MLSDFSPDNIKSLLPTNFSNIIDHGTGTSLRIINYPPLDGIHDGAVRAAHTDINLITLLPAATASGFKFYIPKQVG